MTVTAATPLAKALTVQDAREELSKFFVIADRAEKAPEMFSKFIDAEWHRLMHAPDYSAFCLTSVGHPVGHAEDLGHGAPSWLDIYHERFGTLPPAWFASAEGIVDQEAYGSYLDSRFQLTNSPGVITSWDCTPTTGDPDFAKTTPDVPVPPVPDHAAA